MDDLNSKINKKLEHLKIVPKQIDWMDDLYEMLILKIDAAATTIDYKDFLQKDRKILSVDNHLNNWTDIDIRPEIIQHQNELYSNLNSISETLQVARGKFSSLIIIIESLPNQRHSVCNDFVIKLQSAQGMCGNDKLHQLLSSARNSYDAHFNEAIQLFNALKKSTGSFDAVYAAMNKMFEFKSWVSDTKSITLLIDQSRVLESEINRIMFILFRLETNIRGFDARRVDLLKLVIEKMS